MFHIEALGGPAAPHLRPLGAERRVGERLQRLVETAELGDDPLQLVVRVEPAVEGVHLVAEPVEPLENRVELSVVEVLAVGRHPFRIVLSSAEQSSR